MTGHNRPAGLLVQRVRPQQRVGGLHRHVRRAELERGGRPADPGPAQPPGRGLAQLPYPGIVPLPGQRDAGVEQFGGAFGAGRGEGEAAGAQLALRGPDQPGRLEEVHAEMIGGEPVAGSVALYAVPAQGPAQQADQRGNVPFRAVGGVGVPERVHQRADRDNLPSPFGKHGERAPGLADGDGRL